MPLIEIGMVLAGLVGLYFGAEGLVQGASSMALRLGITPLVVGLTVVSFGTSAPELLVSMIGTDDIAVGNILGSNVANLALVLGAAAMIRPIKVSSRAVSREVPIMVGATVIFVLMALSGTLSQLNGAMLLLGMALYLGFTYLKSMQDRKDKKRPATLADEIENIDPDERSTWVDMLFVIGGIALLALGAKLMVDGSVVIAQYLGVSDLVIGITIVALGTSLPELATSLVAAYRDEVDISVGNVIGSNIFNLFLVLGAVATLGAVVIEPDALRIDLWVMLAVSVGIWPLLRSGHVIDRREGALLLAVYFGYMITLFLR